MLTKGTYYQPPMAALWRGRRDGPGANRFHELVKCTDIKEKVEASGKTIIGILGFACDEGIRRNQGRQGAAKGPGSFRQALANIALHDIANKIFYDFGDIACTDGNMEAAQGILAEAVAALLKQGVRLTVIGGGHEVSWGHYQGIETAFPKRKLAVVNIDAHFDMRPIPQGGFGSSGTSFLQIANRHIEQGFEVDYTCIGIQRTGNTEALFATAAKHQVKVITAEEIYLEGSSKAPKLLETVISNADHIYLSICLDVFAAPFAPGVSSPQPLGLQPWQVIPLIQQIAMSGKLVSFDIAELSPPFDQDEITANLAASLWATLWD